MAISNNNTGLRPGVCTSSTRPTSPYNGQVIYETDTRQTLVYQGSSWVMLTDADTPPGMELVKTQTIGTTVTSVTVTGCFSSTYDVYKITVSGGVSASSSQNLRIQLGGSTTGYYDGLSYVRTDTPTTTRADGADNTNAYWDRCGIANIDGISVDMTLVNVGLAKRTTMTASYAFVASGDGYLGTTVGYHDVATAYTDFTLSIASSTMTGGTIRVYGYRNSI